MNPTSIIIFLALLTLLSDILILVLLVVVFLNFYFFKGKFSKILNLLSQNSLKFALLVSVVATGGSLFLSEVAHFEPCKLCWFQRIFMYPLPLILGVANARKIKEVKSFVLPLSLIGALIALYHYYLQISPGVPIPCSAVGFSVSCSERFFTYFGYITIPWMSFSAFVLIIVFMLFEKSKALK